MEYGGLSHEEMKVTIRLDRKDRQAHICATWPEWSRKLGRLYDNPKQVTQRDGKVTSAFWTIPFNLISLRRGARRLTEAQRQAAVARLRQATGRQPGLSTPL